MIKRYRPKLLLVNQIVADRDDPQRLGTIRMVGPEVSEVRFDGERQSRYVLNKHLLPIDTSGIRS